jgi:hypothetical protein
MAVADDVAALYSSVLGRAPDAEGLAYFTNAVNSGAGTLADVRQALATSPEAQTAIENIYQSSLSRAPDVEGRQYFTDALASGGLLSDVQRDIQASSEAQGLLPAKPPAAPIVKPPVLPVRPGAAADNSSQVNALFQKVFGRAADPEGLAYWGNLLAQGTSLADIEAGLRGSAEFQAPAAQQFQQGIRTVPFGSQLMGGNVQQMAQYAQPAAQAGPAMGAPSLQGFLGSNPAAAALSPFQQSLQYQAALPSMIQPFNPADIPATYQQTLSPTPRLDISSTTIPAWLQASIDAQRTKDGIEVSDLQKFNTANQVSTNSGLGTTTAGVTPGVTGNLAAGGIDPRIIQGYTQIGRPGDKIDIPGAQYWQGLLSGGTPIADIYAGMAGTPEGLLYAENQAAKAAANASTQYYNE